MNRLLLLVSAIICFATCRSAAEPVGSSGVDKLKEASGRERRLDDPSVVGLVLDISGGVDTGFDKGRTRRARRKNAQVRHFPFLSTSFIVYMNTVPSS